MKRDNGNNRRSFKDVRIPEIDALREKVDDAHVALVVGFHKLIREATKPEDFHAIRQCIDVHYATRMLPKDRVGVLIDTIRNRIEELWTKSFDTENDD